MFSYLSNDAKVKYGDEPEREATKFFPEAKKIVETLKFKTHSVERLGSSNLVTIHFSFTFPSSDEGRSVQTEAIDIIEFNEAKEISKITVSIL